jgi:hypothetical protein
MTDEADALAGRDREIDAVQGPNGAVVLLDVAEGDDPIRGLGHGDRPLPDDVGRLTSCWL